MKKQNPARTPAPNRPGPANQAGTAAPQRLPAGRWIVITVLIAGLAGAGYVFLGKKKAASSGAPTFGASVEKTLTASQPRLLLLPASETGIDFQNQIIETAQNNITNNINMYNGGGVAVADINNDQLPDLYFVCSNGKNRLYLNQGSLKFKDITDAAGVGSEEGFETAVTAVDINVDGLLDFYVCRGGPEGDEYRQDRLFVNNGNLTFTEKSKAYGLDDLSASSGANFFDFDQDGDLDLYLLNYPTDLSYASKIDARPGSDGTPKPNLDPKKPYDSHRFFRNDGPPLPGGGGGFVDVSKAAGIWNFAYGLSVSVSDFNRDGYPDVYVGNDFIQPDMLYINNRDGTFTNRISEYFRHSSQSTMGTDLNDFDNDGLVDLFAVDMLPASNYRQKTLRASNTQALYTSIVQNGYLEPVVRNVLQRNNGNGTFSDLACVGGVYKTDWSWSGLLADLDNDGLKDIHVANGYRREITNFDFVQFFSMEMATKTSNQLQEKYKDVQGILDQVPTYKIRNFVFQNQGNFQFADQGGQWMTMPASWSCGSVWSDLDADGDLDLVVSNLEDPAFIYKNLTRDQAAGHYLQIKLQGSAQNPFAVGASALIEYAGQKQYLELNPTRGIFSSVEHLLHFGLGAVSQVDKLTVRWPDGKIYTLTNVPVNQRLVLKYADASGYLPCLVPVLPAATPLLREQTATAGVDFRHRENACNDFERWPLNPWSETDLGPLLAKGDVNGDGLDDFFIGNASGTPSGLFVQTTDGRFRTSSLPTWEQNKKYEAHGAAFFDADGDGDQDLYVVSGGAEAVNEAAWQNNLYLNDGQGKFSLSASALPVIKDLGLRVAPYDYDGDGDLDVFVGGRVSPGKWPLTPRSFVLRNNRSAGQTGTASFTEVTNLVAGDFERCGMVTDLSWADLDGDQKPELIAVGEWMPVTIFRWNNGKLQNVTAQFGLDKSNGLWNRLALADLDGDGDQDLITGNLGLNTRFTASPTAPLRCYAKDFDNNGTIDPIVACFSGGKLYPLVPRDVLVKHIPPLKKKFLYARDYGEATIDQVYPQEVLDAALNLVCYTLETCWWENQGGKFVQRRLPVQAQISPVQGIIADDLNGDGHPDLLLAGNKYGMDVETSRCDAGNGALFLGDGKGGFGWDNNTNNGFWAMREARDLALLRGSGGKKIFIVSNNNDRPQVFVK